MTLTTGPTLTVTQWAASIGISKQAGYMAVKRCSIPVVDGHVDPEIATVLYRRGTRLRVVGGKAPATLEAPARPANPAPADTVSYEEARRRREAAEASIAELKEAEMRGDLVRRAAVERETASRLVALREALEVLADRLAALMAAESDAVACRRMLREEHRNALGAFAAASEPGADLDDDDGS